MSYYDRTEVSEAIDDNKTSASKEGDICYDWSFLNYSFKFQPNVYNRCHELVKLSRCQALSGAKRFVMKCALSIPDAVKKTSVSFPSPAASLDLSGGNFHCPKLLDTFYTILLNGDTHSSTNKLQHSKQSFR